MAAGWWRAFPEQPVLLSDEPDIPEPLGTEISLAGRPL